MLQKLRIVLPLTFFFVSIQTNAKHETPTGDYTLHALYIYNFIKFIQWPGEAKSFKIGVLDNTDAEAALQKMAKAKSTTFLPITVVNSKDESTLEDCQIIFIPSNSDQSAIKLIDKYKNLAVLVITESSDYFKSGATVCFKIVSDKLRFQINEKSILEKKMKVSKTLTTLAEK